MEDEDLVTLYIPSLQNTKVLLPQETLAEKSEFFAAIFRNNWKENVDKQITLTREFDPDSHETYLFLSFLGAREARWKNGHGFNTLLRQCEVFPPVPATHMKLLSTADEYMCVELKTNTLINLNTWIMDNMYMAKKKGQGDNSQIVGHVEPSGLPNMTEQVFQKFIGEPVLELYAGVWPRELYTGFGRAWEVLTIAESHDSKPTAWFESVLENDNNLTYFLARQYKDRMVESGRKMLEMGDALWTTQES